MNTPNKLTVARMILVPFLVLFMLTGWGGEANKYISLAIFVVASVTDWFDGKLARKYNLVTNFGKFMDQAAAANRKAAPSVRFCCAPMSPSQSRRMPRPSGR